MYSSPLEFYERKASANPTDLSIARFGQYAITALVADEVELGQFNSITSPYADRALLLDDPSGHVPRTEFTLGSLSFVLGSSMAPSRVFLQGIGETNRQFTFRLDADGQPLFQIYPVNACF